MNQLDSDSVNCYEIEQKSLSKGFIDNNHNSFDNWFVDTFIRIGIILMISILFIPIFVVSLIFSFIKYHCETDFISINWLLFYTGLKTMIGYNIIVSRLYVESVIAEAEYSTIIKLKKLWNIHMIFEIFSNLFIAYIVSKTKLSNCDMIPFIYLIIYLVLNFIGGIYVCNQYFQKNK